MDEIVPKHKEPFSRPNCLLLVMYPIWAAILQIAKAIAKYPIMFFSTPTPSYLHAHVHAGIVKKTRFHHLQKYRVTMTS